MTSHGTTALPQSLWDALESAYQEYASVLHDSTRTPTERQKDRKKTAQQVADVARAGRKAGWSLPILAQPCGVTSERLRQVIEANPKKPRRRNMPPIPEFPKYEKPVAPKPKPKTTRGHLTARERSTLKELADLARHNTGSRPLNSKYRKASERFSRMVIKLHSERNVTWRELSEATDLTIGALRMRAARHGLGSVPPSIKPYMGVVIHSKDDKQQPKPSTKKKSTKVG